MGEGPRSAILDFVEPAKGGGEEAAGVDGTSVRTSLASAGNGGDGGPWGSMKSDKTLWTGASDGVGSLQGTLKKGTAKLTEHQAGLGASDRTVTGFLTGSAQMTVYESWERYLDLISRECGELKGKLEKAGDDHYKNEEAIKHAFEQQQTKPVESDPGGGGHPSTGGHPYQGR
ncbi:hypothetical protein [Streptomyces armeniacus]|nr:hypothetical protein [Streptomyces armeniacus]